MPPGYVKVLRRGFTGIIALFNRNKNHKKESPILSRLSFAII
jgi:hypothetical protein